MRTSCLTVLLVLSAIAILPTAVLHAQSPPADFSFSATAGGTAPWSVMTQITVDSSGQARYLRYKTGGKPAILSDTTFQIGASGLQQLWKTVQDSNFFSLNPAWKDTAIRGGSFALITVTANGTTHQVKVTNVAQPAVQALIKSLNAIVPPDLQLEYIPPEKFDSTPRDTCVTYGALQGRPANDITLNNSLDRKLRGFPGPYFPSALHPTTVEASHPAVVVSCEMDIQEAVTDGVATLSSKGDFFGDGVTITVDNRTPPPCTRISIKIYLEFFGPNATNVNVLPIVADIEKAWAGARTSNGQDIDVSVLTRLAPGTLSPPNTPGYDDIALLKNGFRSYMDNVAPVNDGTEQGAWEIGGETGEYAHEVGHIMGLPDRYDDYDKQANGSWKNERTGQTFANTDDFANYAATKYPDESLSDIKSNLVQMKVYSIPWDHHENDLMGGQGPLLQSDIDSITAHPGLLVHVPAGTVFLDRNRGSQNLITSHGDDIYAKPGERRIVLGIYVACIDHSKDPPDIYSVFDVAPPLDQWTGIAAAGYMSTLLHFVDSLGLFCDLDVNTQEAVWRISDNSLPLFGNIDSLLSGAGLNIANRILDFPRLLGSSATDSSSHNFLPDQLYAAQIQPLYASGQIGVPTGFAARVSRPLGAPAPVGVSWTVTGPDGAPATMAGLDSTASVTPTRSGVYQVGLQVSMNDSLHGQRVITPDQKAYVIVSDQYTETFEHPGLSDKFPWQSYGDVPWTITNANAETGNYSVTPGTGPDNQFSTLGVDVLLPADTAIVLSVRSLTGDEFAGVEFLIDGVLTDFYGGGTDWTVHSYRLTAGKHRLTWTHKINSQSHGGDVWIDNVFFPGNVVVTSVSNPAPDVPKVFALEQNYPNPFNPKTVIRSQTPEAGNVRIVIYDLLGREVKVLVNERRAAGYYEDTFDGSGLASGVYVYRMTAGSFVQTRKMVLLK